MTGYFLFVRFLVHIYCSLDGGRIVFANFGVFGEEVFFGKVFPQLVPNDSDWGVDEDGAVRMWLHGKMKIIIKF